MNMVVCCVCVITLLTLACSNKSEKANRADSNKPFQEQIDDSIAYQKTLEDSAINADSNTILRVNDEVLCYYLAKNIARSESFFKDSLIELTGKITDIKRQAVGTPEDRIDKYLISFRSCETSNLDVYFYCSLSEYQSHEFAKYGVDYHMTVRGYFDYVYDQKNDVLLVYLNNCVIMPLDEYRTEWLMRDAMFLKFRFSGNPDDTISVD